MKQGTYLTAKHDFRFRNPAPRGRTITVRKGDVFWITNCALQQKETGVIRIDRKGKGCISHGYPFDRATLEQFFTVESV